MTQIPLTDASQHEAWLTLTPDQNARGGEFPLVVRRGGRRMTLAVKVPAALDEDTILRLPAVRLGDEMVCVLVRRAVRPLMPTWPLAALGAGVLAWSFLNGWPVWSLFGALTLFGIAIFGKVTGRLPFGAGPGQRLRDGLFLVWLVIVSAAASSGLAWLTGR